MRLGLAALLLAGYAAGGGPPASALQPPVPAQRAGEDRIELVLRAGTEIPLATREALSSKTARQGQRMALEVTSDVTVDGHVVIPRGLPAVGEVARVVNRGKFGKAGKLEVRAMFLELGGRRIRLDGSAAGQGKSSTGTAVVGVLLIGATASLLTGKSAVLPPGTPLSGYVHQDVALLLEPAGLPDAAATH
jgi:hypothetical protein